MGDEIDIILAALSRELQDKPKHFGAILYIFEAQGAQWIGYTILVNVNDEPFELSSNFQPKDGVSIDNLNKFGVMLYHSLKANYDATCNVLTKIIGDL